MYVRRKLGAPVPGGSRSIRLIPLGAETTPVTYGFGVDPVGAGDIFELVDETRGAWPEAPRFAITADWIVAPGGDPAGFEASRLVLFALRREHIASFHADYLLRRIADRSRYTVFGLYGDEEGLDLARGHAAIRTWAEANPPSRWGARDASGVHRFRVAE